MIPHTGSVTALRNRRQCLKELGLGLAASGISSRALAAFQDSNKPRPDFSTVLSFIDAEFAAKTFPGALLAVTQGRKLVLEKTWGTYCSRADRQAACDPAMVNMCYSVSKLVASTVIVMAQQTAGFEYDTPISKYIPEFTGGGKDPITVRHLLTHSAGLPGVPLKAVDTPEKWDAAVATLCAAKVEWEPGSKAAYHGLTGHFLAAEVVRRCLKLKPWEEICQELLFGPIGAKSLSFNVPPESIAVAGTPQPAQGPFSFAGFNEGIAGHPAGGAFGSADDLLKVLHLHLNGGTWGGKTLIEPGALQEMHTVQYAAQIDEAIKAGRPPAYDAWGLGILLRGPGAARGGHGWFGMAEVNEPGVFGHAGIDTIIAVGDPKLDAALVFLTTDSPKPTAKVSPLRSGTVAKAFGALAN